MSHTFLLAMLMNGFPSFFGGGGSKMLNKISNALDNKE